MERGADPNIRTTLSDADDEPLAPLNLLFFESSTRSTGKIAARIAGLLKTHGAEMPTRGPYDLTPAETAHAMGFKAAAAVLDPVGKGKD